MVRRMPVTRKMGWTALAAVLLMFAPASIPQQVKKKSRRSELRPRSPVENSASQMPERMKVLGAAADALGMIRWSDIGAGRDNPARHRCGEYRRILGRRNEL